MGECGTRTNEALSLFIVPHFVVTQSKIIEAFSPTDRFVAVDV